MITLESHLSIEYIRLEGVVSVQRSPLTTHLTHFAFREGLLGGALKAQRA